MKTKIEQLNDVSYTVKTPKLSKNLLLTGRFSAIGERVYYNFTTHREEKCKTLDKYLNNLEKQLIK